MSGAEKSRATGRADRGGQQGDRGGRRGDRGGRRGDRDGRRREPGGGPVPPESLRVAVLSDAVPGRNGVGTYYDDLAQHLADHVERVELLCPPRRDEGMDGESGEGGAEEEAGAGGLGIPMPGDPTQRLYLPPVTRVWRRMTELRPHVILAGTPGAYGLLGLLKAGRRNVPFCYAHHTELSKLADLYWTGPFGRIFHRILARWNASFIRRARTVMVHNEELVETVREMGARRVELVGTPMSKSFLDGPVPPLDAGMERVTFVGRLAPEKELGQIVDAAVAHSELRFRIVGDGPLREKLEAEVAKRPNLEMVGWVDRSRVREILDESDVLVLPSRYETFGTVALEAMARGRLTVVSSRCGIAHWPDLAAGLFPMEPDENLAHALNRLRALSPDRRKELADRGRAAAVSRTADTVSHIASVLGDAAASLPRTHRNRGP